MAHFEAKITDAGGGLRVTLAGECDLAVAEQLSDTLLAAVRRAPLVIVDLAALGFLDSSGVHGLISAHHAARERGGRLVVVNPVGAVATVLDLTGVGALLSPSPDGALLSPSPDGALLSPSPDGALLSPAPDGALPRPVWGALGHSSLGPARPGAEAPSADGERGEIAGQP